MHAEGAAWVNSHPAPVAETCVESVLEAIVRLCQSSGEVKGMDESPES